MTAPTPAGASTAEEARLRADNQRLRDCLSAADDAVTAFLMAIAAEQPGFDWTADRTADAVDVLTKVVLPLGGVADEPTGDNP